MDDETDTRARSTRDASSKPTSTPRPTVEGSPQVDGDNSEHLLPAHQMETLQDDRASVVSADDIVNNEQDDDNHHEHEEALEDIIGDGQTKYELRQKARDLKSAFTRTWIDDDKTGLYDPAEEQRKLRRRPKRPNPLLRSGGLRPWYLDDESDKESELCAEPAPKLIPKLEVTLKFTSEAGRARFQEHVNSLPAPPEPSEELFSERRLRRRDSGIGISHTCTPRSTNKRRLPDDLPEDLTGHPIARGCWECLSIGIRCPLLDDDRAWPCTTCLDDDNQCELITPPNYKRACEHCKSRRFGCSYTYTLNHDEPCDECSKGGWRCIAGPAKEAIRERITYDRDWENDPWQAPKPPKVKKLPSCRRCRELKQPCSFSAGDKGEVCTACDMANQECLPELETSQSRKRKRTQERKRQPFEGNDHENDAQGQSWGPDVFGSTAAQELAAILIESGDGSDDDSDFATAGHKRVKTRPIVLEESSESSDDEAFGIGPPAKKPKRKGKPSLEPKPKQKQRQKKSNIEGTLETISAEFAHPIAFNYEGQMPCNFCSDIRFAMFGLGTTEVEVINWHDGRGLEESSGGHRERGIENTRMCVACTTNRIPAIMCAKHELRPLEDAVTDAALINSSALTSLLSGTTTGKERWCSICPTLAQYECCTNGPLGKGCGLMLCESCMVSVVDCDGDLEQALKYQLKDETSEERVLGLRADHEFLKQEGLLMRYVLWESSRDGLRD